MLTVDCGGVTEVPRKTDHRIEAERGNQRINLGRFDGKM
jgi:hypothetical protein